MGVQRIFFDKQDDNLSFDEESQKDPSVNKDILMLEVIKDWVCNVDDLLIMMELDGVVDIDDDNQPNEKNVPSFTSDDHEENCIYKSWGHSGICVCRASQASDRKPKLKKIETKLKLTHLQMFENLFPVDYMKHIMLPKMNVKLSAAPISYGELLQFLSIWLHISTTVGFKRREFWSIGNKKYRDTPMKFNTIMSRNRLENILTSPTFTADVSPPFKD